jgi:nucleoside-diphosphate-sugar epimerase
MTEPQSAACRQTIIADIDRVLGLYPLPELAGKRIFLTGGTGFIGYWLLMTLSRLNARGARISVVALSRNPERFLERYPEFKQAAWLQFMRGDVRDYQLPEGGFDLFIHGASDTSPKAAQQALPLFETMTSGTQRVLDHAVASHAERVLVISSGAVYGEQPLGLAHISETTPYGCNPLDAHDVYGEGKRAMETLTACYMREHGLNAVIARCFSFIGYGLPEHLAIGSFINQAISNKRIVIRDGGKAVRSYLYAADMAIWLLALLMKGLAGKAYNVGSDEGIRLDDLAELICDSIGMDKSLEVLDEEIQGKRRRYVPDISSMLELGVNTWTPLPAAIRQMASCSTPNNRRLATDDTTRIMHEYAISNTGADEHSGTNLNPPSDEAAYMLGRDYLGEVFALFSSHILALDQEHHYDRIFFVSRDAYVPWLAFKRLAMGQNAFAAKQSLAKSDYVYLSRMSTQCPESDSDLDESLFFSSLVSQHMGMPGFFHTLGLDVKKYRRMLEESFTQEEIEAVGPSALAKLRRYVHEHPLCKQALTDDVHDKKNKLRQYLRQIGFWGSGKKVLFVDVGWRGSIVGNIESAFSAEPEFPDVHFVLLGYVAELKFTRCLALPGFLYDSRRPESIGRWVSMNKEAIEAISSSTEGTCLGYKVAPENATCSPILRPVKKPDSRIDSLHKGILCHVDKLANHRLPDTPSSEQKQAVLAGMLAPFWDAGHPLHTVAAQLSRDTSFGHDEQHASLPAIRLQSDGEFSDLHNACSLGIHMPRISNAELPNISKDLLALINRLIWSEKTLIFWGLGSLAKIVYPHVRHNISHIVDASPAMIGRQYEGHIVESPEILKELNSTNHIVVFWPLTNVLPDQLSNCGTNAIHAFSWFEHND